MSVPAGTAQSGQSRQGLRRAARHAGVPRRMGDVQRRGPFDADRGTGNVVAGHRARRRAGGRWIARARPAVDRRAPIVFPGERGEGFQSGNAAGDRAAVPRYAVRLQAVRSRRSARDLPAAVVGRAGLRRGGVIYRAVSGVPRGGSAGAMERRAGHQGKRMAGYGRVSGSVAGTMEPGPGAVPLRPPIRRLVLPASGVLNSTRCLFHPQHHCHASRSSNSAAFAANLPAGSRW